MTTIKLLSASLITTAMLTAAATAREHRVTPRHPVVHVDTAAPQGARYIDGTYCVPAPRVGAFATQPWDKAPPCEPTTVY